LALKTLEVKLNDGGTRVLVAEKVFLNVGTHAAVPNVPGLHAAQPLTHVEALELDYLPQHLIVIGGGYSGLEFAQAYRRFGSKVTVVESGPQLLAREDIDVSREMQRILSDEAIQILVEAELLQVVGRSGEKVTLTVRTPSGEQRIDGSDILVAAGRVPNTAGIGLEDAGVELDGRGYIRVNGRLEASAPDVWAFGECAGSPQFTHISEDDFRIVRDNLAGGNRSTRDRLVPFCMFTDPPLARVGLSENEAERQGVIARVARLPMNSVLGAQATDEREGFMKTLVGDRDDRILGFTMIGAAAGEVMASVHTAILAGLPYSSLANADFAHPTMAEGLSSLFSSVPPRALQTKALAEDLSSATAPLPPGTFTTSAHSDEWKIANALSAGPAGITDGATVIDWPANPKDGMSHGRVLRQGTNGWTCMPDVPGRPQHDPMCVDETMMKWLDATLAGKKPDIDRVGLSYMLMGEAREGQGVTPAKDPSQVKEWFCIGPHIMIVLPDSAKDALRGINQDLSNNQPYTSLLSSADVATPIWIIPVAKGGHRIGEEPAK
jgi:pyruvate/2-oxoglutarate dehydrogenase complex dihydrolipoamide dehydrogenase (E3) component